MPMYDDVESADGDIDGGLRDDDVANAYLEGEVAPVPVQNVVAGGAKSLSEGEKEVAESYVGYSQPHNVQKSPTELGEGRGTGTFESPYGPAPRRRGGGRRGQVELQRPCETDCNLIYSSSSYRYGERKRKRKKRGAEHDKTLWAIHRLTSTGMLSQS